MVSTSAQSFHKGDVYCLANFTSRAEQWYKQEVVRQIGTHALGGPSAGGGGQVRRQPSRVAKNKLTVEGPYVLSNDGVAALHHLIDSQEEGQMPPAEGEEALHTTRTGQNIESLRNDEAVEGFDLRAHVACFSTRLIKAIHSKRRQLKARYEPAGIQHICTVADSGWQCLDEEYCGHGLIERCMRWIPKGQEAFGPRVRAKMDQYLETTVFSLTSSSERVKALKVLKQRRYSELKKATADIVSEIVEDYSRRPTAMVDAHMLATPTLGKWPARGFVREDVELQTIALAGLLFAVDMCQRETRVMMM